MLQELTQYPLRASMAILAGFKDGEKATQKDLQSRREATTPHQAGVLTTLCVNLAGLTGVAFAKQVQALRVACGLSAIADKEAKGSAAATFSFLLSLVRSPLLAEYRAAWVTLYGRINAEGWTPEVAEAFKQVNPNRAKSVINADKRAAAWLADSEAYMAEALADLAKSVGVDVAEVAEVAAKVASDVLAPSEAPEVAEVAE